MTSIEWLYDQMIIAENIDYRAILKKAKEMHKQEIKCAYLVGREDEQTLDYYPEKHSEDYYNETYKKD